MMTKIMYIYIYMCLEMKLLKKLIKFCITLFKRPLEIIFTIESRFTRAWASSAHKRLMKANWSIGESPEWFDHTLDLFHQWPLIGNSLWLERGIFTNLCLERGGNVLEICCGDGFNSSNFYSHLAKSVVACDFDPSAIRSAKKNWSRSNINFLVADIRYQMPKGKFENIIWDAAIEHFSPEEISKLMIDIKSRMNNESVLSGYTIVERDDGNKHLPQHEYEFKSKEDLMRFFTPHFEYVVCFETIFPSRHNLYFWASDEKSKIPFTHNWNHVCKSFKE